MSTTRILQTVSTGHVSTKCTSHVIVTCSCIIKAREYADSPQTIFSCVSHFWGGGLHGWMNIPTCRHPPCSKMAASTNGDALTLGKFHWTCAKIVTLSKDRQTVSRESPSFFSFQASSITPSNVPIPEGLNFLLNILHKGFSNVSLISAPSIPQASDTPYKAGGAVHVVNCYLFFVQSGYWSLLLLPIAINCSWLWYRHAPQSVAMGILWLGLGWGASNSGNNFLCAPIASRANNGSPQKQLPRQFSTASSLPCHVPLASLTQHRYSAVGSQWLRTCCAHVHGLLPSVWCHRRSSETWGTIKLCSLEFVFQSV